MTNFDEIYVRYFSDVYKYILSLCRDRTVAEDVTQETFFRALKSIGSYRGDCKLSVWLCQIAKNTYFSESARAKRFEEEIDGEPLCESVEQKLISAETALEVHRALHALGEPYKEVFSLRTFGELPFSEIAELFGRTESWARVTFHRAKLKIKEELKS